ncbi:hypothetical protein B0H14DRAFT_2590943 [Mycena olivaceomarginata]|nr:hypothetical protein B0H14DRAFT_2590943 [Mycena olivaceomarginata]
MAATLNSLHRIAHSEISHPPKIAHLSPRFGAPFLADAPPAPDPSRVQLCDYLQTCLEFLPTWDTLRALVVFPQFNMGEMLLERQGVLRLTQDLQFVVMDWIRGATLGRDHWSRAEQFIAKRRSREIDPLEYYISETYEDADA